ncbi:hypothetical protein PHYPO_G00173970 [Pangasianodon hypophthalmus]|uniref:Uncharacterized protein n=1 Tax=Pangasianodon hypophthalmus TaxID=310915 RepID=A0A5N5PP18_PANHP|nr:hypothetical protein PHYPO_G00173970 [Pangasianodon hypophthalmus]
MICLWWIIFKTFFLLVKGGASSGSAEAAGGLKGGAGQNAAGVMNSMVLPQLLLIQQVPAPIGANNNQGAGLPVVFVQQQQAGVPNSQAQPNPPMVPVLALLPQEPNGVNGQQVQLVPVVALNVQQGAAAAGKARVKVQ